jgi:hypothetical protein
MTSDLVFAIDGIEARLSDPVRLHDAGPGVTGSYTEWIVQHPQLLGARVRVVASDLRWEGHTAGARIDVLGLDSDGRLVVGVVVVDDDPDQVLLRALTQAAYASRLDPQTLAEMHARHLRRQGQHVADDVALHRMVVHTGHALDPDKLAQARMVLFTEHVSPSLGTTIVWLDEMGLDIALQRLQAYQVGDQALLIVSDGRSRVHARGASRRTPSSSRHRTPRPAMWICQTATWCSPTDFGATASATTERGRLPVDRRDKRIEVGSHAARGCADPGERTTR